MSFFEPKRRIEVEYQNALRRLVDRLLRSGLPFGDSTALSGRLAELTAAGWFKEFAFAAASNMVTGLNVGQCRTWREAARESMQGPRLYAALQNEMHGPIGFRVASLVRNNAFLIRSLPSALASETTAYVAREQQKGRRSGDIADDLRQWFPDMARSRVKLIARTETSKASTALTEARSEELGLKHYVWTSSKDQRVRPSHRFMAKLGGVICSWNDPPSPEALIGIKSSLGAYSAGNCPNCRCFPSVLLRLSQVEWPHRVYEYGRIKIMTRVEFSRKYGRIEIAA
jgi:SPP1 gp7 family putative phage head morphogenesis protein